MGLFMFKKLVFFCVVLCGFNAPLLGAWRTTASRVVDLGVKTALAYQAVKSGYNAFSYHDIEHTQKLAEVQYEMMVLEEESKRLYGWFPKNVYPSLVTQKLIQDLARDIYPTKKSIEFTVDPDNPYAGVAIGSRAIYIRMGSKDITRLNQITEDCFFIGSSLSDSGSAVVCPSEASQEECEKTKEFLRQIQYVIGHEMGHVKEVEERLIKKPVMGCNSLSKAVQLGVYSFLQSRGLGLLKSVSALLPVIGFEKIAATKIAVEEEKKCDLNASYCPEVIEAGACLLLEDELNNILISELQKSLTLEQQDKVKALVRKHSFFYELETLHPHCAERAEYLFKHAQKLREKKLTEN